MHASALDELELGRFVARHLRPELAAVGEPELHAHLEAEVDDTLDRRLRPLRD